MHQDRQNMLEVTKERRRAFPKRFQDHRVMAVSIKYDGVNCKNAK